MRNLLYISCIVVLTGCTSLYSNLQKTKADVGCLEKFRPKFSSTLYSASIDVVGKHLSGLLIFKKMPDSSTRIVFSSETGFTFFDFEFSADGNFLVHSIIKQMNKKPVIKTLRKDFELILMQGLENKNAYALKDSSLIYIAFPQANGFYYYVTNTSCTELVEMQRASKRKVVVEAVMKNFVNNIPDTISFSHKKFNFEIGLKYLQR
ncbi:MAG: hypothetical protein JST87_07755 [Bacteroidetes bacterium]|nr:hypothetical protein [Bacteroidota bacterium]